MKIVTKKNKIKYFILFNVLFIPLWSILFGLHAGIKVAIYSFFGLMILIIFTKDKKIKDEDIL